MNTNLSPRKSTNRKVERIVQGPGAHWVGDGFKVRGYINPSGELAERLSPFLLLDYHEPHVYPPTTERRGVGPHPHRGFETVSLAFEGSVTHLDSTGAGGIIGPGDVQWMTAGSGILHREYHEEEFAHRGGRVHFAQIWVNLPRQHKMTKPGYQALTSAQMGVVHLPDNAGVVRVIAGEYRGTKGPAKTFTPVSLYEVRLEKSAALELEFPAEHNVALLVMEGALSIGSAKAATGELVVFQNEGDHILLEAESPAHLLALSGEPIREPIVQYGPFVMNSRDEIRKAIDDFNRGKFGSLDP